MTFVLVNRQLRENCPLYIENCIILCYTENEKNSWHVKILIQILEEINIVYLWESMKFLVTFYHYLKWFLKRVQVFALYGKAGTGKSFRAKLIAQKYKIELIIDDGILIKENRIIAGKSAKKEKFPFAAVKTALFDDKKHRVEVHRALEKEKFKKILIIGTSRKMTEKIVQRLNLPAISKFISIEDIATREEIEEAIHARTNEGKHIIPVPGIEIKRKYGHIFLDSIKVFLKNSMKVFNKPAGFEKSIVTPEFSKKGRLSISETALLQMIMHCISEYNSEIKVEKIVLKNQRTGFNVLIGICAPFGMHLPEIVSELQEYVIKNIDKFTGITFNDVSITVETIA